MDESKYLKDNQALLDRLSHIPTLDSFPEKDLKGLLELSKIRKYEAGELIMEEGVYDCWIYFLISGLVRVAKQGEDIGFLKRTGDVFGEMCIIDSSPRSASVYAVKDTVCLATDASYIERLSGNNKIAFSYIIYHIFAEILAHRLRLANEEMVRLKEENERLRSRKK